jgi:hypothetical protein
MELDLEIEAAIKGYTLAPNNIFCFNFIISIGTLPGAAG